jgi:hypothetical protein
VAISRDLASLTATIEGIARLLDQTGLNDSVEAREDAELRQYGRGAQDSADPKKNFGPRNPARQVQLDEARAEWRRRHPAAAGRRNPRMPDL